MAGRATERVETTLLSMIEISIVIPSYRRPELLRRALASCLAQQGVSVPVEIVVVDNDEAGSARPVVEAVVETSPIPIRYVAEPRPGISHARNTGVASAGGRYIAFLDDDEAAEPAWLAALLDAMRQSGADAVVGPVYPQLPASTAGLETYYRSVYTIDARVPTGSRLSHWSKCNGLFEREACFGATHPPFDPQLGLTGGEDSLFLRQLMRRGGKVIWCAEAVVRETIPPERLTPRYLLRRIFRGAQTRTFVYAAVRPAQPGRAAFWMAVGCVQIVLYTPAALVLRLFNHERWLPVAAKAAGGLGKVLWHPKLHPRLYH